MAGAMNHLILLSQLSIREEADSIGVGIEVFGKITRSQSSKESLLPKLSAYSGITLVFLGVMIVLFILMIKRKREKNEKN